MKNNRIVIRLFMMLALIICVMGTAKVNAKTYKPVDTKKLTAKQKFFVEANSVQYKGILYFYQEGNIYRYTNAMAKAGRKPSVYKKNIVSFDLKDNYLIYTTKSHRLYLLDLDTKKKTCLTKRAFWLEEGFDGKTINYVNSNYSSAKILVTGEKIKTDIEEEEAPKAEGGGYPSYFKADGVFYATYCRSSDRFDLKKYNGKEYEGFLENSYLDFFAPLYIEGKPYYYWGDDNDCFRIYRFENGEFYYAGEDKVDTFIVTVSVIPYVYDNYLVLEGISDSIRRVAVYDKNFTLLAHADLEPGDTTRIVGDTWYVDSSSWRASKRYRKIDLKAKRTSEDGASMHKGTLVEWNTVPLGKMATKIEIDDSGDDDGTGEDISNEVTIDISKLPQKERFIIGTRGRQYNDAVYYVSGTTIYKLTEKAAMEGAGAEAFVNGVDDMMLVGARLIYTDSNQDIYSCNLKTGKTNLIAKYCRFINSFDGQQIVYYDSNDSKYKAVSPKGIKLKYKKPSNKEDYYDDEDDEEAKKKNPNYPKVEINFDYRLYETAYFTIDEDIYFAAESYDDYYYMYKYDGKNYVPIIEKSTIVTTRCFTLFGKPYFIDMGGEFIKGSFKYDCNHFYLFENDEFKEVAAAKSESLCVVYAEEFSVYTQGDYIVVLSQGEYDDCYIIFDKDFNMKFYEDFNIENYYYTLKISGDTLYVDYTKWKKDKRYQIIDLKTATFKM